MDSAEIRKKFLRFFKASPRNHKEISPAPLVPPEDPTTLFTSSGMQKLIPYLMGEPHPEGKRLVDSQPCLRLEDIDEVGDNRHQTFFEMLGNWSLGDYFKEEQLAWFWQFLTKELGLPQERLWVSVFEGVSGVPKDEESYQIWKKIGVPEKRIFYYGAKENWWSRSGVPKKMPEGEIGGPDSEVFFEFNQVKHDPKFGKQCHPNCQCGRFSEIGNSVFIQYKKEKGRLREMPQRNVDFGGGLERTVTAVNNKPDIFQIDLFKPIIQAIEKETKIRYGKSETGDRSFRIVADHLRASVELIKQGVEPSNKLQGYALRRLIRKAAIKLRQLTPDKPTDRLASKISEAISRDKELSSKIGEEVDKFLRILDKGVRLVVSNPKIKPFDLYQTYGIPFEVSEEVFLKQLGKELSQRDKAEFDKEFEKHQKLSRTASAGMFKGGLADTSEETKRLHTATHLLHAALRKVLGEKVQQKGSNITAERLRFDFSHPKKLKDKEIKRVEELVNRQVEKDLPISFETKTLKEALDEGALAFFGEKYDQKVKVYTVGDPKGEFFSKEVCGGPHVKSTAKIGRVRIKKQEKIGSGLLRIYATIGG